MKSLGSNSCSFFIPYFWGVYHRDVVRHCYAWMACVDAFTNKPFYSPSSCEVPFPGTGFIPQIQNPDPKTFHWLLFQFFSQGIHTSLWHIGRGHVGWGTPGTGKIGPVQGRCGRGRGFLREGLLPDNCLNCRRRTPSIASAERIGY